jgi:hypothetical protein
VTHGFDPGALLGASYQLPDGTRVRLRLTGPSDTARLRRLLDQAGEDSALAAARLIRFDPRTRLVVCAAALTEAGEALVGVGAIALDGASEPQPDVLVIDAEAPAGVRELLAGALVGRAAALARIRAA